MTLLCCEAFICAVFEQGFSLKILFSFFKKGCTTSQDERLEVVAEKEVLCFQHSDLFM